jgi:folate-binding protein YgfZ
MPHQDTLLSGASGQARQVYAAARTAVAFMPREDRGRILLRGPDRASYLHGLLTNDINALAPGTGCYAAYLTPQGRMISDLWVYELGDVMLVVVGLDRKDALLSRFDQFIFSEDVQLGDVTGTFGEYAFVGPESGPLVASLLSDVDPGALASLGDHGNARAAFGGQPAIVIRSDDLGAPGFSVLVDRNQSDAFLGAVTDHQIPPLDLETAEILRIEGGIPRFGQDMDAETIPLEAGLESRAISLTKGCYVGQEVIIRILHRGHGRVAKKLVGLTIDAEAPPPPGTALTVDGREVGQITSSGRSPSAGKPIALAYIQRDHTSPGTAVAVAGAHAVVTAIPFR